MADGELIDRLKTALQDRYTIEREIGRGGMATVYLAEDIKHHRKVAVKVLRPELAQALGADRFHQEIEIAAQLTHPHILPLHDSGEADGFLYFVMPYIEGQSLRDKLAKEGELPIAEAVRILRDVVEALKHAHKHSVVHRDIKPDNVMLSEDHALVTDFGVAKAVSDATGAIGLTTEGVALGTPAYMSPEQASADPHIDHRADIYAVGVIAYELLTGRTPFVGTTQQELLAAHVTQTPDPVTKYRESVPPALAALVMRCLEKKAADRWQTAEELLPQLELLATPSGGTTPVGTVPISAANRSKRIAIGASAFALVFAVLLVMILLPRGGTLDLNPNHVVVAEFRNATGDPSLDRLGERMGHWITQGIQRAAVPVTPWDIALQSSDYVQAELEAGRVRDPIRALAEEAGAGIVVSGTVYLVGSDSLEIQTNVTDARRGRLLGTLDPVRGSRLSDSDLLFDVQERVMAFLSIRFEELLQDWVSDLAAEPPSFEAQQEYAEGFRLLQRGENEASIPHFLQAFELDSTFVQPLIRMAVALQNLRRSAEHDSVLLVLESFGDRLTPFDRASVEYRLLLRGGDREAALRVLGRAVELAPGSPEVTNYAMQANRMNRPRQALDVLSAVDPERGQFRQSRRYWDNLTNAHLMLGELEEALEAVRRGRQMHPEAVGLMRYHAVALAALGKIEEMNQVLDELQSSGSGFQVREYSRHTVVWLRYYGYADAAIAAAERAITWLEARPSEEAATPTHRWNYGQVLFLAGRVDEAHGVFDVFVEESPNSIEMRVWRAFLAALRGDTAQALSDADWFDNLAEQLEGRERDLARWWRRGVIYGALGDHERAMELFRQFASLWNHSAYDHIQVLFEPMRDCEPFQEFLRPKG